MGTGEGLKIVQVAKDSSNDFLKTETTKSQGDDKIRGEKAALITRGHNE